MHIYPVGGHGLSLARKMTIGPSGFEEEKHCQSWVDLLKTWLEYIAE